MKEEKGAKKLCSLVQEANMAWGEIKKFRERAKRDAEIMLNKIEANMFARKLAEENKEKEESALPSKFEMSVEAFNTRELEGLKEREPYRYWLLESIIHIGTYMDELNFSRRGRWIEVPKEVLSELVEVMEIDTTSMILIDGSSVSSATPNSFVSGCTFGVEMFVGWSDKVGHVIIRPDGTFDWFEDCKLKPNTWTPSPLQGETLKDAQGDAQTFPPAKGGSPFIKLFNQELNKYPKNSWAHSITRIEVIPNPHPPTYDTHLIRGISSHPSGENEKAFRLEISSVDAFIKDQKTRMETVSKVVNIITMAWKEACIDNMATYNFHLPNIFKDTPTEKEYIKVFHGDQIVIRDSTGRHMYATLEETKSEAAEFILNGKF